MTRAHSAAAMAAALAAGAVACVTAAPIPPAAADLNNRGTAALEAGRLAEAKNLFELANEHLAGNYPEALVNLAIVALQTGDLGTAKELCTKGLRLRNGELAIRGTGRPCEAAEGLRLCVEVAAGHAECQTSLPELVGACAALPPKEP